MRVASVTPGRLFPDDGPRGARLIRRIRGITLEVLAFVLVTLLFPALVIVAALVDLALWLRRRKPWTGSRLVVMLWLFLFAEMRALAGLTAIWVLTGGPWGKGSMRRRRWLYDLRIHWARSHLGAATVLFGLRFEIKGLELAGPGPVLIMIRHASIIDNMLPDSVIGHEYGMGLRFVIKRELQMIPTIDIGGRWVPANFVRRASDDPEAEIAALRGLGRDLEAGEGVLIYPEGTRFTPAKLARAKEKIAERAPAIAPLANRLQNVLPPRVGGPLALLDESAGAADVVFFGHVGFDGFEHISDIWAGGLVGKTIRIHFWRHPAAEVPAGEEARIAWLYERWQVLDDWVASASSLAARPRA